MRYLLYTIVLYFISGDVKCELEALYSLGPGYLGDFLEKAILTGDYI